MVAVKLAFFLRKLGVLHMKLLMNLQFSYNNFCSSSIKLHLLLSYTVLKVHRVAFITSVDIKSVD